jgi:hypothetical protein
VTTPPLPVDVSGIDEVLPDPGHEAIRLAALNAIVEVARLHQSLLDTVTAQGQQIAALQAQVAALTPAPVPPDPPPAS